MNAPAPLPPPIDFYAVLAADPAPIPPPLFPPEALPRAEYLATLRAQAAPPAIPPPIPAPVPVWQLPAGTTLRAALGTSTVLPDLDFETYSEAGYVWDAGRNKWGCLRGTDKKGLGVVGAQVYAEHPSTEVLSLYYDLKDGRGARRWLPTDPMPPVELFEHVARGGLLEAWNSGFEYRIWNIVCRRRYGWPALPLEQLRCAMAKSRAFSLPGALGKAGQVLALELQKDKDGERLLKKFSMPRDPTAKDVRLRIRPAEDSVDGPKLYAYNERDIQAEAEASARTPDLNSDELAYWQLDQAINLRGVQMDVASIDNCLAVVDQAFAKYDGQLAVVTGGAVLAASQMPKLKEWLEAQGVRLPRTASGGASLTDDVIDQLLEGTAPLATPARQALELRQKVGSASIKKLFSMARMVSAAGRLHDLYNYYGARTGRTTGQDAQPTNLPKAGPAVYCCAACGKHYGAHLDVCAWCRVIRAPGIKPDEWSWRAAVDALEVIATRRLDYVEYYFGDAVFTVSGCLRGLFIAGPGMDLICSDYSAIEAVVLAMVAGVQWRIDVFRTHGKIYEASAAMMAKLPVEEVIAHKKLTGSHHPLRDKGKRAELACGYGGWVGAWIAFGADKYMTEEEMKKATLEWRAASPEIPEFWGGQWRRLDGGGWRKELFGVEGAFVGAILSPGTETEYRGFKFRMEGDALYLRLLSGRYLTYHRPRLALENKYGRDQFSISYEGWNTNPKNGPIGWIRIDTYGGRLTENIVQATARDIQWYGMRNLTAAGYPIVLHVYDEDVAEVPEGFGSVEEFERIMSTMPPWAADWPIRANGGWRGKRYRKD
jgi:DNA polymerase